jgi:hypothetical protein
MNPAHIVASSSFLVTSPEQSSFFTLYNLDLYDSLILAMHSTYPAYLTRLDFITLTVFFALQLTLLRMQFSLAYHFFISGLVLFSKS